MAGKENTKIAPRYARALFELVPESELDAVAVVLSELAAAWQESKELRNVILNPGVPVQERTAVLRGLVESSSCADIVGNFLSLLLENRRIAALTEIHAAFAAELASVRNMLAIEITSAYPLNEDEKAAITERLRTECGSLVSVTWRQDTNLIGGFLIKTGDRVLDNTVRGSLEKIRQSLAK